MEWQRGHMQNHSHRRRLESHMRVPQVQATYVCMRRSLARCPARFRWPFSRCVVERLGVTDFGDGASVLRWPSDCVSVTARVLTRFDACRRVSFCGALAAWRSWLALLARSLVDFPLRIHLSPPLFCVSRTYTPSHLHTHALTGFNCVLRCGGISALRRTVFPPAEPGVGPEGSAGREPGAAGGTRVAGSFVCEELDMECC